MGRTIGIVVAYVAVLLLSAAGFFFTKYRQSEASLVASHAEEERVRMSYGEAIGEIATIQDSLNSIVLGEEAARLVPADLQAEIQLTQTQGDQVLSRIAVLKAGVERTKQRIQELDTHLKRSGIQIAGLEKLIAGLRRSVREKEERITELASRVDTLQTQVAGLSVEVEEKTRELGTIFYAMGSKKDLMGAGVVVAKGGVLGIGKTLEPSGHVDETRFIPLDTDEHTVIQIPSARVEILSAQPVTSYTLLPAGEDVMELRILDSKEFRKIKHLVILTA